MDPRFHPNRSCVPVSLTREICQTGVMVRRVREWEGGGWDLPQDRSQDDACIARLARLPDLLVVFLEVPLGRFDGDNPEADDAKDDVLVLSQH